jgi:hypothetical protein
MRVEDLRGPKIGDTALILQGAAPRATAFHDHASQGEWHTLNSLVRVAGQPVDGVVSEAMAVVEWWRTIETLLSLLHGVAVVESDRGLRPHLSRLQPSRRQTILDRWSALTWWFSEGKESPPSKTTGLMSELRDFRNSFEHASRESVISTKHSKLSTSPAGANLSDAMEALAICVLVTDYVRFVLPGCDLMPQVIPPSRRYTLWVALDDFAAGLAFPAYARVVNELGLTTDVELYEPSDRLAGTAEIDGAVAIKARPDAADLMAAKPIDLWPLFEEFTGRQQPLPAEDEFALPRYTIGARTRDR